MGIFKNYKISSSNMSKWFNIWTIWKASCGRYDMQEIKRDNEMECDDQRKSDISGKKDKCNTNSGGYIGEYRITANDAIAWNLNRIWRCAPLNAYLMWLAHSNSTLSIHIYSIIL